MTSLGEALAVSGPVRAIDALLCDGQELLIVGEGCWIKTYRLDSHSLVSSVRLPGGDRVTRFKKSHGHILVLTEFHVLHLDMAHALVMKAEHLQVLATGTRDRILDALMETDSIWIVSARGTVHLFTRNDESGSWSLDKTLPLRHMAGLFYSASIRRGGEDRIELALGTIFSGILLATVDVSRGEVTPMMTLTGHTGTVFDVCFHPTNAAVIVSCSDDRTIRIWTDVGNCHYESVVCAGHDARVWTVALASHRIASVSEDNTCRVWSLDGQCQEVFECDPHAKSLWCVAFDDGRDGLLIGSNDGCIYRAACKKESQQPLTCMQVDEQFGRMRSVAVSSSGDVFVVTESGCVLRRGAAREVDCVYRSDMLKAYAVICCSSTHLFIGDCKGQLHYARLDALTDFSTANLAPATSSKVSRLFTVADEPTVVFAELEERSLMLFDTRTRRVIPVPLGSKHKVTSIAYVRQRNMLFLGTRQGVLLVYTVADALLQPLSLQLTVQVARGESLRSMCCSDASPDTLLVADHTGHVHFYSMSAGRVTHRRLVAKGTLECFLTADCVVGFHQHSMLVHCVNTGAVMNRIVCGGGHRPWSIATDGSTAFHFRYIADGRLFLAHGRMDRVMRLRLRGHGREVRAACELPDGLVATGSEDGLLLVTRDGATVDQFRIANSSIKCVVACAHETGVILFTGGSNEAINAWRVASSGHVSHLATCPKASLVHEARIMSIDVRTREDGCLLVIGYSDSSIRLWIFCPTGRCFSLRHTELVGHADRCVQQTRFLSSRDQPVRIVSAGTDGRVKLWTLADADQLRLLDSLVAHQSGVNCIDILGDQILTGGDDGSVHLAAVQNDSLVMQIRRVSAHHSTVTAVRFLDETCCVSSSVDQRIVLYSLSELQPTDSRQTCIADIAAMSLIRDCLSVHGAGSESFALRRGVRGDEI